MNKLSFSSVLDRNIRRELVIQGSHMVNGTRCPAWSDQLKKWSESRRPDVQTSRRPEKAHLRANLIDWSTVMRHVRADLGGPRAQMTSGMRAD